MNDNKLFEIRKKAAQAGSRDAQMLLADMYAEGQGVEKDYKAAWTWYERARQQDIKNGNAPRGSEYSDEDFFKAVLLLPPETFRLVAAKINMPHPMEFDRGIQWWIMKDEIPEHQKHTRLLEDMGLIEWDFHYGSEGAYMCFNPSIIACRLGLRDDLRKSLLDRAKELDIRFI